MKNFKETIILFFGVIIISFIFWNRFLKQRESYSLDTLFLTQIKIISILGLILLFFILFCKTALFIILQNNINKKNFLEKLLTISIIKNTLEFINIYVIKSPENVYEKIYAYKYYPVQFLTVTSISYLVAYCYYPNSRFPLIKSLFFIQLPKIIAAIIFFVDIYYYHQISLFIKYIWLLIIPLITKVYLYICAHNSTRNINYFDLYIEFYRYADEDQCYIRFKDKLPNIENPLDITKVELNTISNWYSIYGNIRNYVDAIKKINDKLDPYFSLITYALFTLSWSYYLWYVINL